MAKIITSHCSGIKCDNPACDYKDMSVKFEDYPNYVNRPCPKCGSNLLTKHDYKVCKFVMRLSKLLSHIEVPDETVDTHMQINLNGTDNIDFEVTKISPTDKKGTNA